MKEAKSLRKVQRMRGLPKSRVKRLVWRLNPKHLKEYWFSRDGGIMALKVLGIAILVIFVLTLAVFAYFRKELPDVTITGKNLGGSISYYDKTGKTLLFQDYNAVKRVPVQSNEINNYLKEATIATEDRNFYNENGFDIKGIARAGFNDVFHRGGLQGGSTITQQLVKLNEDWTQQRTITRKVKELILSVELERTYTKDQILTGYLNIAPYGGVDYGAQAAAGDYFQKSAKDLTLAESAFLAAIPKSPSYYSPYGPYFNKNDFISRYNYVLDSMVQTGKINKKQADAAKKIDILAEVHPQQTKYAGIKAPYFVLAARNEVLSRCAGQNGSCSKSVGGWKVITTLDMNMQNKAEELVQQNIPNIKRYGADEEAVVAESVKTGQVAALVGGTDFNNADHGQINYAQINISPGSSFKPYDYASFVQNENAGAGSVLYDVQQPLPGYPCTNKAKPFLDGVATGGNCLWDYDFNYPGALSLRYALGGSRNVPAVKSMLTVGVDKVINIANNMMGVNNAYKCYQPGVDVNNAKASDQTQCYGASAIGDGAYLHLDNHVNGLASMARLGASISQTYILEIQDASGKPIYKWTQPKPKQVIDAQSAYIVNNMLSDSNASYLPAGYYKWQHYNGWDTAVKTGTTNNGFDGLMMGWNTQYAVGSWVGYHTRTVSLRGAMEYMTTPLTKGLMTYALDSLHTTPVNWKEPAGIQHLPAYVVHNHVGIGSVEPSPGTEIYPSWYKPKGTGTSETIDKVSNKLATSCTPDLAKLTQSGDASANKFSVDIFYGSGGAAANANTTAQDDVHNCGDQKPTITLTVNNGTSGTYQFVATVSQGTHALYDATYASAGGGYINFMVDGKVVNTAQLGPDDASSTTKTYTFTPPGGSGSSQVTAQIVDSVLYDTTSNAVPINFTGASGPAITTVTSNGTTITINWSGGTAPFTAYRADTGTPIGGNCTKTSSSSCTAPQTGTNSSTMFYVKDDTGQQSNQAHY